MKKLLAVSVLALFLYTMQVRRVSAAEYMEIIFDTMEHDVLYITKSLHSEFIDGDEHPVAKDVNANFIIAKRKIFHISTTTALEKFAQKQIMYVRNYTDGLDVSWKDFFQTEDKSLIDHA